MRNGPIESLVIGCGVALGVLLVHTLTQGASVTIQLLALLAAGAALFCIQLALASRRGSPPPAEQGESDPRPRRLRQRRRNPFTRELTDDWTGLEDHPTERDLAGPYAPGDLDELWGDPPDAQVRKSAGKLDDPR